MPNETKTPEEIALAQHGREVSEIIDLGRTEYGSGQFDEASATVAEKLGPRAQEFMAVARQYDYPHRLITTLANDPAGLERLAKMPTARMLAELARIEARMAPYGHVITQADPAWKGPSVRGRVSDKDWSTRFGEGMSEEAFDKEFWRRQKERKERFR